MKRSAWLAFVFLFLFSIFLSACNQEEATIVEPLPPEQSVDQNEPAPEPEAKPEHPYTAPLTGLGSEIPPDHRIIMVMVENHEDARPQSGLNKADMVYEVLAEGGITRFAAFFHSEYPENVGPVRSIRPYFLELGGGYDAIMVHAGGSLEALNTIAEKDLPTIDGLVYEPKYFWRVKFRKKPHNLYTDFTKIKEAAARRKYREEGKIPQFRFLSDGEPVEGENPTKVEIRYFSSYRVGYEYDPQKEAFLRTIDGEPHTDLLTGEQIAAANILVIKTKHRTLDSEGRLAVDLKRGGEGFLFQKGKAQKITWKNVDGVIRAFKDGREIGLSPGKTWINIIPDVNAQVTYE